MDSYHVRSIATSHEPNSEQLKEASYKTSDILNSFCNAYRIFHSCFTFVPLGYKKEPNNHSFDSKALELSTSHSSTEHVLPPNKCTSIDDSTLSQHSSSPEIPPTSENDVLDNFSDNMWISVSYALYSFLHYVSSW
jgi:hypothetical protein